MPSIRVSLLALALLPPAAVAQRPAPKPAPSPRAAPAPAPLPPKTWVYDDDTGRLFDEWKLLTPDVWVQTPDAGRLLELDLDLMRLKERADWDHWKTLVPDVHVQAPDLDITLDLQRELAAVPLAPLAPMPPMTPLAPDSWRPQRWHELPSLGRQSSPDDSLYRRARETLNRGEYRQAAELLRTLAQRYPNSRHVSSALYWQAFALYRAGTDAELRRALDVLDEQQKRFGSQKEDDDAAALVTRVVATLAARGDAQAASRVQRRATQAGPSCDQEDLSVRAEALSALVQSDPGSATTVIQRVLARRDECSVPLRRRAVYLIGRDGIGGGVPELTAVAKNDPDASVRRDAIARLAQLPGGNPVPLLEQLFAGADEPAQRAVVQSLRSIEGPETNRALRRIIEREDVATPVRVEAIRSLVRCCAVTVTVARPNAGVAVVPARRGSPQLSDADVTFLRSVYERAGDREIKTAVLEAVANTSSSAADQWLMAIARNGNEDMRYRRAALSRLRRSDVPIEELSKLYDTLDERELRSAVVNILGAREEPAATDKLLEIVKNGTDPNIRRQAINALGRKNDPRTTRLLLELVEK